MRALTWVAEDSLESFAEDDVPHLHAEGAREGFQDAVESLAKETLDSPSEGAPMFSNTSMKSPSPAFCFKPRRMGCPSQYHISGRAHCHTEYALTLKVPL